MTRDFGKWLSLFAYATVACGETPSTEALADAAQGSLAQLFRGEIPEVSPSLEVGVLRPEPFSLRENRTGWVLERANGTDLNPLAGKGKEGLLRAFKLLANGQLKLKTVAVDVSSLPILRTEHLANVVAENPGGRSEYVASWEATWETQPKLSLRSLKAVAAEELTSLQAEPWLADLTQPLLSPLPWFREQYGHGNSYWRARLQNCFDQFVYGHRGMAVGDANGDGRDDVYLCEEGGLPNRLLLQLPDGTVEDASAASGTDLLDATRSALFLDLDEDGDEDLALATPSGLLMLENLGETKFRQRTLLPQLGDGYSLAAADYDANGYVDIYLCSYQPKNAEPARLPFPAPFYDARNGGENFLVSNQGNWQFSNATKQTGLDVQNNRFSFSALWTDVNDDALLDLMVVNDFGQNVLYTQARDASGAAQFTDDTLRLGLAKGAFGMAVTGGDFNRDGRIDLYTSNMFSSAGSRITTQPSFLPGKDTATLEKFRQLARGNSLFQNGEAGFTDIAATTGTAMGRWSWGAHVADLDNDGWEDLLIGNGNITGHLDKPDL
jgi:hypothetical protein